MITLLDLTRKANTDPTAIYRYRDGLYAADLLIAGLIELDFFTWLARGPATLAQICRHFEIAERPTDVMVTLFAAMGLIHKQGERWDLSELGREHLVTGSTWGIAPYFASLKDRPVAKDFLKVLKTDKPANWGSAQDEQAWVRAMENEAFARSFTAAMDCRGIFLARAVADALPAGNRTRLLDIAGGSGIYACSLVAAHPGLSASVFERPPVDQIAKRLIAERGCANRVTVVTGDMFQDPLPAGYDIHLFSNVLHDWNEARVHELLSRSFQALAPGGLLVIHDAHLNADKTGPLHVAEYSALLMHATEGRCYSTAEMETYLTRCGFGSFGFAPTAACRSIVTAVKPGTK